MSVRFYFRLDPGVFLGDYVRNQPLFYILIYGRPNSTGTNKTSSQRLDAFALRLIVGFLMYRVDHSV